jgi:hypothetical protein
LAKAYTTIPDQLWSLEEPGHHQVTTYGIVLTSKAAVMTFLGIDVCDEMQIDAADFVRPSKSLVCTAKIEAPGVLRLSGSLQHQKKCQYGYYAYGARGARGGGVEARERGLVDCKALRR